MKTPSDDLGVIQVLLDRLNEQRLPRLLNLKKQVDAGEPLRDADLQFLQAVGEDATRLKPLIDRHPEYQPLVSKVLQLFADISEKAMDNEQRG